MSFFSGKDQTYIHRKLSHSGSSWDLFYYSKGTSRIFKSNLLPNCSNYVLSCFSPYVKSVLCLQTMYVFLLLFWWWTAKPKATKNSCWSCLLASTSGTGYPPSAASCANFLTFKVSDFRRGILSMLCIPVCALFNFPPPKSDWNEARCFTHGLKADESIQLS